MSWLYFPAVGGGCSPVNTCSGIGRSVTSKRNRTASRSSKRGSQTGCSTTRPSGTTAEHSPDARGVAKWISSLPDSRASRSAARGKVSRKKTSVISGRIPFASLAKSGPNGSFWKMSQGSLPGLMSDEFSQTWPRSGIIFYGTAFPLRPLAPITNGIAFGLLPTPTAQEFGSNTAMRRRGETKRSRLLLWPSPTVPNGGRQPKGGMSPTGMTAEGKKRQVDLQHAVRMVERSLWPSPTVGDSRSTHNSTAKRNKIPPSGIHSGNTLVDAVTIFPTPTTRDNTYTSQASKKKYKAGPTLREFVKAMYPTPQSSEGDGGAQDPQKRLAGGHTPRLRDVVMFPTPTTPRPHDSENTAGKFMPGQKQADLADAVDKSGGQLNPMWVEWLMGWPLGWTDLKPLSKRAVDAWLRKTLSGTWWLVEPKIPRVVNGRKVKNRVGRLAALGNGQVPLCAAVAFRSLSEKWWMIGIVPGVCGPSSSG